MDSLYWAKINNEITQRHTKKMYFGRHLWRLEYKVTNAHLITEFKGASMDEFRKQIAFRLAMARERAHSGSIYYREGQLRKWEETDFNLLEKLRGIRTDLPDNFTMRVESDYLKIYADNESDLQMIAERIGIYDKLLSITYPKPGTEEVLRSDVIYMPRIDYKYKVILRDGDYSVDTKRSILTQLIENPEVKISPHLYSMLIKKYTYLWGSYFYTNDDSIVTMLCLIAPGIVGKIHRIEKHSINSSI